MLLKELLESYNYKTTAVSNGKFLLEELNTNNYDLLIVDNQMPDIDGVECIKKIREMNFDIPIILAAGSQTNIGDLSKERIAADKFIGKPYNFTEMLGLINDLIDR
jgi:DNA-binding response OmpR family regulator